MSLQQKLETLLFWIAEDYDEKSYHQTIGSILSLIDSEPSEYETTKACQECNGTGEVYWDEEGYADSANCSSCNGTGVIARTLTRKEAEELPRMLMDGRASVQYKESEKFIFLWSTGERVRLYVYWPR